MYLNRGTDCEVLNKIIGQVNGTNIVLFGHTFNQFRNRVAGLQSILNIKEISYDYLIKQTMKAIEYNYDECLTKCRKPVWKVLHGDFNICCDGKIFKIEISTLIKSSKINFDSKYERVVAEDYKEYVKQGIMRKGDIVIAIETLAFTIKHLSETKRMNFTEYDVVRELKFEKKTYVIQPEDITTVFPDEVVSNTTMCTNKAFNMFDDICYKFDL